MDFQHDKSVQASATSHICLTQLSPPPDPLSTPMYILSQLQNKAESFTGLVGILCYLLSYYTSKIKKKI